MGNCPPSASPVLGSKLGGITVPTAVTSYST